MKLAFKAAKSPGKGRLVKLVQEDPRFHNLYFVVGGEWFYFFRNDYVTRLVLNRNNHARVDFGGKEEVSLMASQLAMLIEEESEQFRMGDLSKAKEIMDNFEALVKKIVSPGNYRLLNDSL